MIIPDEVLLFFGILLFIEILINNGLNACLIALFDGIISFIVMLLLKLLGDFIFKRESMGGGDIKLLSLFGIVLGWKNAISCIFLGALIGLPISLIILIKNTVATIYPTNPSNKNKEIKYSNVATSFVRGSSLCNILFAG